MAPDKQGLCQSVTLDPVFPLHAQEATRLPFLSSST